MIKNLFEKKEDHISFFGTDGIRGKINQDPLTPETIVKIAIATSRIIPSTTKRPVVVIGKDTRLSGYMVEPALTSGFVSMGVDVLLAGPLPTPAIAMLTKSLRASLGIVISASHNYFQDNGIKIFGPEGYKLSDEQEAEIEYYLNQPFIHQRAEACQFGRAKFIKDAKGRYIEFAKNTFPKHQNLKDFKIVIDCAHGAAYKVAPSILWELGATIIEVASQPDGININKDCGAVSPNFIAQKVVDHKADIGFALDGDADRLIVVDEKGHIMNGDLIIAMIAKLWKKKNILAHNKVVTTIMSNSSMEDYLKNIGVGMIRTPVGDRHIITKMREKGYNLGGEQSGHIICTDYNLTGDGMVAALQILSLLAEENKPLSEVAHLYTPYPQFSENIHYQGRNPLHAACVQKKIKAIEKEIYNQARLLIRLSGTEPLIRIMTESQNDKLAKDTILQVSTIISEYLVNRA